MNHGETGKGNSRLISRERVFRFISSSAGTPKCDIIYGVVVCIKRKKEVPMGELYRIGALVISMRYRDNERHHKPHVHAKYEEFEASVGVDGELLIGSLPQKQMKILVGWLAFHEEEVYAAWELAVQGKHFEKIVAKI